MLVTASFYDRDRWRGQPYRISVGYPRGQRKAWQDLPFLAPNRELVQAYRRGHIDAQEYERLYLQLLQTRWSPVKAWLESLSSAEDVTLLCFEPSGHFRHRQVVARLVREHRPDIPVHEF